MEFFNNLFTLKKPANKAPDCRIKFFQENGKMQDGKMVKHFAILHFAILLFYYLYVKKKYYNLQRLNV